METRAHFVAVGAFVLAIIVVGFLAVIALGRGEFAQELKRYYVFYKGSVTGLSRGSQVQYNGITVGRVIDIRVDPDDLEKIQVTVEIDTNAVRIKTDARAFLESNLLSGISTVQIRGGTREAKDLEPEIGHRYPVIAAGSSVFQRVTETGQQLIDRLMLVVDELNNLLNEQNRKAISESLQNVRTITGALVEPSKEVSELVDNANTTVLEMRSLLRNIDQSYAGNGGLKDQVSQMLGDYDRLAKNLIDTNRQLQLMVQESRPGLKDFSQRTLNQLSELVNDMQQFVKGLGRFVTALERDPTRLLFGERREGYRPQ